MNGACGVGWSKKSSAAPSGSGRDSLARSAGSSGRTAPQSRPSVPAKSGPLPSVVFDNL